MWFNVFVVLYMISIGLHCFQLCFLALLCSARACAGEAAPAGEGAEKENQAAAVAAPAAPATTEGGGNSR